MKARYIVGGVLAVLFAVMPRLFAGEWRGRVTGIVDGDTLIIYDSVARRTVTVRLPDIDAPELGQVSGVKSRSHLSNIALGHEVVVFSEDPIISNRVYGRVYLEDGNELGMVMLGSGYAWHHTGIYNDPEYLAAERRARSLHFGLWEVDQPMPPWEYRSHRPVPPPDPFPPPRPRPLPPRPVPPPPGPHHGPPGPPPGPHHGPPGPPPGPHHGPPGPPPGPHPPRW